MDLSTSLVDIVSVRSTVGRSDFSEVQLEEIARSILESGNLVFPLLVKRIGIGDFEVVEGDLEYYAAVKANEIDSDFEMVRVFIIDSKTEEVVQEQVKLFKEQLISSSVKDAIEKIDDRTDFSSLIAELKKHQAEEVRRLERSWQSRADILESKLDRLDAKNSANGIEKILHKHLENLQAEVRDQEKDQALRKLTSVEDALSKHLSAIRQEIHQLRAVDLRTASQEQLTQALKQVGVKPNNIDAAWKAIEYWKKDQKDLSWENLKKSTFSKGKHKVTDFGDATYKKLEQIGKIEP